MRVIIAMVFLLFSICAVRANDTAVHGASGTVTPLAGEHAAIRMVNETVRMDISPRYYDVQADFLFHNTGKATTVTMGFPETGTGDGYAQYRNRSAFQYFRTTVDGRPVTVRRQPGKAPHEMSYMAWWTKEVSFAAGQQRRVTVAFRAPVGETAGFERWALYHFTGGNWAGTVGRSRLRVRLHLNGTYAVQNNIPFVEDADGWHATWHDWEAEETAVISFQRCGDWDLALRGLDIPREKDHYNWLSPRMRIVHLRTPGVTDDDKSVFIPPAFAYTDREGTVYIGLWALKAFFAARRPDIPTTQFSWQDGVRFSYMGTTLQFKEADYYFFPDNMHPITPPVASSNTVAPEVILVDMSSRGMTAHQPYVKAESALRALGVGVNTDYANHLLTLQFPTPQSCLFSYKGKTYYVQHESIVEAVTGKAVAHLTYPTPTPMTPAPVPSIPYTIGTHLLLPFGESGTPDLYIYDLAKGIETGEAEITDRLFMTTYVTMASADQRYLYRFCTTLVQPVTLSVMKYDLHQKKAVWQRELPDLSTHNRFDFIAEQDGNVALYTARRLDEGIIDPAEVLLLDAENGNLKMRYWCWVEDAVPERLPRWVPGPTDTRALLNVDGRLLAGTYGQGIWHTDDGKAWSRVTTANIPSHIVSLGASRHGDIVAGTWMQDGLTVRSVLDPTFRLLAWPNNPRWPRWWNRDYSRCMTVGYCGDALYVQSYGGFLRWTPKAGWTHTTIPANDQTNAVINDGGIWTASADSKAIRIRHYTPSGTGDLDVPVPVRTTRIQSMATARGSLYLITADGRLITCAAADLREYGAALKKGLHPLWSPLVTRLLGPSTAKELGDTFHPEQSIMIHTEQGYQPFIIVGTSHGPLFVPNHAVGRESATLVPSLAAYDTAFATYRDATGEWLVMGGKHGIVMLPISVIKASNFAASGFAVESDNAANDR